MRQKRKKSRGMRENPLKQFPNVCTKITNLTREFTYGNKHLEIPPGKYLN